MDAVQHIRRGLRRSSLQQVRIRRGRIRSTREQVRIRGGGYDRAGGRYGGATIATILALSNLTPQTAWMPFEFTVAQNLSGQTVRLRVTSSNDGAYPTSFFFDTLALTATHGCP
jgi:hypothetical protein